MRNDGREWKIRHRSTEKITIDGSPSHAKTEAKSKCMRHNNGITKQNWNNEQNDFLDCIFVCVYVCVLPVTLIILIPLFARLEAQPIFCLLFSYIHAISIVYLWHNESQFMNENSGKFCKRDSKIWINLDFVFTTRIFFSCVCLCIRLSVPRHSHTIYFHSSFLSQCEFIQFKPNNIGSQFLGAYLGE